MSLEDKILAELRRSTPTWDQLRAEVGAAPGDLDAAIRNLENSRLIYRERARFYPMGAHPVAAPAVSAHSTLADIAPEPETGPETDGGRGGKEKMTSKICKQCKREKPLEQYPNQPQCRDGHSGTCKACLSERAKKRYREKQGKKAKRAKVTARRLSSVRPIKRISPARNESPPKSGVADLPVGKIEELAVIPIAGGVRLGPLHKSGAGLIQMPYWVDLSHRQLDELHDWCRRHRA